MGSVSKAGSRTKDQDRQEETDCGYLVVISKIRHQCLFLKKLRHGVADRPSSLESWPCCQPLDVTP